MTKFITKDKKVIPIKDKNISSKKLKTDSKKSVVNKEKAQMLKDKPEKIHGESVIGYTRHHPVTIQINLDKKEKGSVRGTDLRMHNNPIKLSISASEWNLTRSDCTQCGQMQDTLREDFNKGNLRLKSSIKREDFKRLLDIWDEYHLNDLNGGTERQSKIIDEHKDEAKYEKFDRFLDRPNAILKDFNANPDHNYKYGSAWLFRPIPDDVQEFVRKMQRSLGIATN